MGRTQIAGQAGEDAVARYLESCGLQWVASGFRTRFGEIDLIFRDHKTWVFVEVKTRTHRNLPSAADAVTLAKQKRLVGAALSYMKMKRLEGQAMRFDVLLMEAGQIEWIRGAFDAPLTYTF
jgi:putative endonuclease